MFCTADGNIYVWYWFYGVNMYEETRILTKIEVLVDKLPYKTVDIRIELADKVVILHKEKSNPIGFITNTK